jgi:hypothetical protein
MTTQTKPSGGRPAASRHVSVEVRELDHTLLIRVPLAEGVLEVRVPENEEPGPPRQRHHIPGFNPEATPC